MAAYVRKTFLVSGVLAGLICAAVGAEAQAPVPDLSSNGVGWIAINRDFVAVWAVLVRSPTIRLIPTYQANRRSGSPISPIPI